MTEVESVVEPNGVLDYFRRESVALVSGLSPKTAKTMDSILS
jgi:hypothetical protein